MTEGHMGYDDVNFSGNLFKVIDIEESTDRETIHLLIHLLMQFMSRPDLAYPTTDEKPTARYQSIVLKHLYLLMGFNQIEKTFNFSAPRIRCSSVYNSFMASLPQFLDQNHEMGAMEALLNFTIHLLIYSTYASNTIPATFDILQNSYYSLWCLEIHVRRNWIMAVLVILYKYNLKVIPEPLLTGIIRIVMSSLDSQFHQCRRIPTTIYQQDLPKKLEFGQSDQDDQLLSQSNQMKLQTHLKKLSDISMECDETESELVAIPESDLSDSTLQGSIDGGMSDDIVSMKTDTKKKPTTLQELKKPPKPTPLDTSKSISEGVRMMFSSAILSPPVNVQKAVVVTQAQATRSIQSSTKDACANAVASVANNQFKTATALTHDKPSAYVAPQNVNGKGCTSPTPRVLGRQQRIIDTNGEDCRKSHSRSMDHRNYYGSPESPLSRMDVMSPPDTDISSADGTDTVMSQSNVQKLELPAFERLLPIGGSSKENVSSIVDRVREGLSIPDISHLRSTENLDEKSDMSPPNSSRAASPRKLTKQVALIESPPNGNGLDVKKNEGKNELNVKEDKKQVSHKIASKSIDERLKFAGSWAPPSSHDDNDDDDDSSTAKATTYVSIDTKPVSSFSEDFQLK